MTEQLVPHYVRSHGAKVARVHMQDWIMLLLLVVVEIMLNLIEPFHRFVGEEMMTDLKYPFKENTVPIWAVPIYAVVLPICMFLAYYYYRRDVYDLHHSVMGILFSAVITGVITDAIKVAVGRPRPNFFYRCFPNGIPAFDLVTKDVLCHGDMKIIKEGYKSFPSGHTSWSFAGLCFFTWYLSGKIMVFDRRGHIAKLCVIIVPLLLASLVGVSRVDDYWHHWTDVFTGAIIGIVVASACYLVAFPYPNDVNGWAPHAYFQALTETRGQSHLMRGNSSASILTENRKQFMEFDTFSSLDGSPILEAMETGRRH